MLDLLLSPLSSVMSSLGTADPLLLWGVYLRVYACVFAFAIAMQFPQIRAMAGKNGLFPIQVRTTEGINGGGRTERATEPLRAVDKPGEDAG